MIPPCCRIFRSTISLNRASLSLYSWRFLPTLVPFASRDATRRKTVTVRRRAQTISTAKSLTHPTTRTNSSFEPYICIHQENIQLTSLLRNMLLPSALSCDVRRPSRFAAASRLLSTPPPSDDEVPSGNGLMGTCRALQSLLNGSSPAPSPRRSKPARLQSPLHIRSTPSSARSRNLATPSSPKQTTTTTTPTPRRRRQQQQQQQPRTRGVNKRRRNSFESDFDYYNYDRNVRDLDDSDRVVASASRGGGRFSTPKRRRHVPYDLPLGLSQSDFYSLHSPPVTASPSPSRRQRQAVAAQSYNPDAALPSIEEGEEQDAAGESTQPTPAPWTAQDDQCLVEAVLEKFQLSQEDWDECAQRLGRDQVSAGRRWQALVGEGNIGLRSDKLSK